MTDPHTQSHGALTIKLKDAGPDFRCQLITASFKPPKRGPATIVRVACPPATVAEPGALQSGELTGQVYADTTDAGITTAILAALEAEAVLTYTYAPQFDTPASESVEWRGTARVSDFQLDHADPGTFAKHPLSLEIITATRTPRAARAAKK